MGSSKERQRSVKTTASPPWSFILISAKHFSSSQRCAACSLNPSLTRRSSWRNASTDALATSRLAAAGTRRSRVDTICSTKSALGNWRPARPVASPKDLHRWIKVTASERRSFTLNCSNRLSNCRRCDSCPVELSLSARSSRRDASTNAVLPSSTLAVAGNSASKAVRICCTYSAFDIPPRDVAVGSSKDRQRSVKLTTWSRLSLIANLHNASPVHHAAMLAHSRCLWLL